MGENESLSSGIDEDETSNAINDLVIRLPAKSQEKYEVTFNKYQDWCKKMGTGEVSLELINEKVLISYFNYLISKDQKPPTLWSNYSMIRSMIAVKKSVDISKYSNLLAMLKRKSVGYKPRKSKTFERRDVSTFLSKANDGEFLLTKVAFIIGLAGACKNKELADMTTDNVHDKGDYFHFILKTPKMKVSRDFVVTAGNIRGVNLLDLIRKYINLRPCVKHNRFFIQYSNGVCTRQPVGINALAGLSKKIAKHLKLKNPDQYSGHCLRRSCTLLLAGARADILTIKRQGGWKSSLEAEGYFFSSLENKRRIAENILGHSQEFTSTLEDDTEMVQHISFTPSSSIHQGNTKMEIGAEPIECAIEKRIVKCHSPLAGEVSSREIIDNVEYTENLMKLETFSSSDLDSTSDPMETEETNEFCEELDLDEAESKYFVPPDDLGRGHLDEMNKSDSSTNLPVNGGNALQASALNVLDIENKVLNPFQESHVTKINKKTSHLQGRHQDIEFVHVPGFFKGKITRKKFQVPSSINSAPDETTQDLQNNNFTVADRLSVESIAEKVIQKLLSSTSTNSQVLCNVLRSSVLASKTGKQTAPPHKNKDPAHAKNQNTNQMQDIGSKVLRMFVIDKQIEKLVQEKKDIYKELFSIGEISSSLFNLWAQEKMQSKNSGNIVSE